MNCNMEANPMKMMETMVMSRAVERRIDFGVLSGAIYLPPMRNIIRKEMGPRMISMVWSIWGSVVMVRVYFY